MEDLNMKKIITLIIIILVITSCFTACKGKTVFKDENLKIVSTIFPGYDFAKEICGDKASVDILLPPGSESHSYEPTPQDIIKIQNCDLFIYVGGESDAWVDTIINSFEKPIKTIKMMDCVSVVEEEQTEGMESNKQEESGADEIEYDEHVWTSPVNAIKISQKISDIVSKIDTVNSSFYNENKEKYVKKLDQLDKSFKSFFNNVKDKTLIFGDRFPLRYFVEEYRLKYYAAFPGCSNETEPSAATIAILIDKVKSENTSTVFYTEFSNHKVADSIAETAGIKTAMFHSCHNVSKKDFDNGATYFSLMENNLQALKEAMK
jgi:zinc transport system substrate-binding protein